MDILDSLANIGFDWRVALANLINFLIVFWLLKRFVFAPMQKTLAERRAKIEKGVEDARLAETERLMAEEERTNIVNKAHSEANTIVAGAREKEDEIVREAHSKAQDEATKVLENAERATEERRRAMEREVKEQTVGLVMSGLEKVLQEKVDSEKDEEIIRKLVTS